MAPAGSFDNFGWGTEDFFGFPDGFAGELVELFSHGLSAAVVAVVVQQFLPDRVTAEERYREDQEYEFPKHGRL